MSNRFENKGAFAATIVVAASDSLKKRSANFVCDGTDDQEEILAAVAALPQTTKEQPILYALAYDSTAVTYTDETLAAKMSTTPNDMTLLPAAPAVGDIYYFGFRHPPAGVLTLNVGQAGVGVWTITWEFWDGAGNVWREFTHVGAGYTPGTITDNTTGFHVAGSNTVEFTNLIYGARECWADNEVNGYRAFWLRARLSAWTNTPTQPLGTQATHTAHTGGGRVLLLDGHYSGTGVRLYDKWGITIEGQGENTVWTQRLITAGDVVGTDWHITSNFLFCNCFDCAIKNFTIDGQKDNQTQGLGATGFNWSFNGIYIYSSKDILVENMQSHDIVKHGLAFTIGYTGWCNRVTVNNLKTWDCGHPDGDHTGAGIGMEGSGSVRNLVVNGFKDVGSRQNMLLQAIDRAEFHYLELYDALGTYAVTVYGSTEYVRDLTITDFVIKGIAGTGIRFANDILGETRLIRGHIDGTGATGRGVLSSTVDLERLVMTDVFIENFVDFAGVDLSIGITEAIFTRVKIKDCTSGHGGFYNGVTPCMYVDCETDGCYTGIYGIGAGTTVLGGSFHGSTVGYGIYASDRCSIIGAHCYDNDDSGIIVTGDDVSVIGCHCYGHTNASQVGIYVTNCQRARIIGNIVYGNYHGIRLYNSANECVIANNTVYLNNFTGIRIELSSNENLIEGNYCIANSQGTNNLNDNIMLLASDYNSIQGNTCRQGAEANAPKYGINISNDTCDNNIVKDNDLHNSGVTANLNDAGTLTHIENNRETEVVDNKVFVYVKNTSGGDLVAGNVVILKGIATAIEVDTTAVLGDDKVYGMVAETIVNNAKGYVLVEGFTAVLNFSVDQGAVGVGDFLACNNVATEAALAVAGDMVFAMSLEIAAADVALNAVLIKPRKL